MLIINNHPISSKHRALLTMSEFDAFHAERDRVIAEKFEELYNERGRPTQLNDEFLEAYFESISYESVTIGDPQDPPPRAPHTTYARLWDSGRRQLVWVEITSKGTRFVVQKVTSGMTVHDPRCKIKVTNC